jgi:hypothetical protein
LRPSSSIIVRQLATGESVDFDKGLAVGVSVGVSVGFDEGLDVGESMGFDNAILLGGDSCRHPSPIDVFRCHRSRRRVGGGG